MAVHQVKVVHFGDFGHFNRQSQSVGRVVKHGISSGFDFMEHDVRLSGVQAHRQRSAYEMNLMSTVGKFLPKFRRNNAASTVSRIAGNADFHGFHTLSLPKVFAAVQAFPVRKH
jgi:hypothetical protein